MRTPKSGGKKTSNLEPRTSNIERKTEPRLTDWRESGCRAPPSPEGEGTVSNSDVTTAAIPIKSERKSKSKNRNWFMGGDGSAHVADTNTSGGH